MKRYASSPWVWTATLPPLFALPCAWFWGPPLLWSDTATGLLVWRNFAAGGTWNTIALPDPANIAQTIEKIVTWWIPGQYMPLGLLISAGMPLGVAMLLLATASALSCTIGLVRLAVALGAPDESRPWIALGAAASWHTLFAFGMFNGGETALIALWPWIALAGWKLRERPVGLALLLPPLFLPGSITKHSLAIYGLTLLAFRWIGRMRVVGPGMRACIRATAPLALAGLLYLIGLQLILPSGGATPSSPGQVEAGFAETWGFGAFAPLFSAAGADSLFERLFFMADLTFAEGWRKLGPALVLLSPLPLLACAWLARRSRPLERFAGLVALATCGTLYILMWRGGSISLEGRHFRPAGVLLLAVLGTACVSPLRRIALAAYRMAATAQRHHNLHVHAYPSGDYASITDPPPAELAELRALTRRTAHTDAIRNLPTPSLPVALTADRLITTDLLDRDVAWIAARPWRGRVSLLTLAPSRSFDTDGRGAALRASFVDYQPSEWTRRVVAGWDFWSAAPPASAAVSTAP